MNNKSFKTENVKRRFVFDNNNKNDSGESKNFSSVEIETLKSRLSRGYQFRPFEHKAQNDFFQRNISNLHSRLTYPDDYNANKGSNFGVFYSDYQVPQKKFLLNSSRGENFKERKQSKPNKHKSKTRNFKKTNLKTDQTSIGQNKNESENENLFTSTDKQSTNLLVVSSDNQSTSSNSLILKIENKEANEKFWSLHESLFKNELPRFQINKKQPKMSFHQKKTGQPKEDCEEESLSNANSKNKKSSTNYSLSEIESNLLKLELNETKTTKSPKPNFQTKKKNCKQTKSNDESFDFSNIDDFWEDDLNIFSNDTNIEPFSDEFL
jgi:hypothetical protein